MKILIFGLGSIGSRHAVNLESLRPMADQIHADPAGYFDRLNRREWYADWRAALHAHPDADCAIISSPTECHLSQAATLLLRHIPVYVEKPMCAIEQRNSQRITYLSRSGGSPSCVGFQYRFHIDDDTLRQWRSAGCVSFFARENLIERYGPTCLETMASHSIDLALWAFGPVRHNGLVTDGRSVRGWLLHESGDASLYDIRIDTGPRVSTVTSIDAGRHRYITHLNIGNDVYCAALDAWLRWVAGDERNPRTATLSDGLCVMDVMARCKKTIQGD